MKQKLTIETLKRIIQQEAQKFGEPEDVEKVASKTTEVDADEYADTLEKQVDMMSALKIEEARLNRRLKQIGETKAKLMKSIKEGTSKQPKTSKK